MDQRLRRMLCTAQVVDGSGMLVDSDSKTLEAKAFSSREGC